MILELFCGAGGSSEGVRRAGGVSHGVDDTDQPEFRARFGDAWFTLSDALDVEVLRGLVRKHKPIAICASPPCEGFSTATFGGEPSRAPRLISATRDALRELGLPFVIENVLGARHELSADALCLRGQDAGLQTERPRLFEAGNGLSLRLDRAVASGGAALRARCCLGARSRYGRQDGFGMLQRVPCCCGNIYGIQGSCPWRCTAAEAAASMGVDLGHMSYRRLAQAVPPAYSALIFGQVAMHVAHTRYGVPPISFDDSLARPEWARRQMALLLRGAGGVAPQLGVELQPAATPATHRVSVGRLPETAISHACEGPSLRVVHEPGSRIRYCPTGGVGQNARVLEVDRYSVVEGREVSYVIRLESGAERHTVGGRLMAEDSHTADSSPPAEIDGAIRGGLMVSVPSAGWSLSESDFREVEYTYAGDYDQVWTGAGVPDYLAVIRPHTHVECPGRGASWRGHNSFVHVQPRHVRAAVPAMAEALQTEAAGTRISLVLPVRDADPSSSLGAMLAAAGFEQVCRFAARQTVAVGLGGALSQLPSDVVVLAAGRRECHPDGILLVHDEVEPFMDPRDRGQGTVPSGRKNAIAWSRLDRCPERWRDMGMSAEVERRMTEGVTIEPVGGEVAHSLIDSEVAQYAFKDEEHLWMGALECDRALVVGHLEFVPADEVEKSLRFGTVHPWQIVRQSESKWRAAQDYKMGTNQRVVTSPFTLPDASDVRHVVGPDSHFGKYDLRDGFWSVGIAPASRHHLMVRHPATGQLLRCTSLPFGYSLSPLHFCAVTEAVAGVFRRRTAGMGIHLFVFVDDFLCVGDTRESTEKGMQMLEALLDELGLPWAPHKQRGPARVMEFLGVLLVNTPKHQCFAVTRSRQERLTALLSSWAARRPKKPGATVLAEPRELASLIGQLGFCSSVVPNGRTYLQAMSSQFKGLTIDWVRGVVRSVASRWQRIELGGGFWRDLHWWTTALQRQNCRPMNVAVGGPVAVVGTDASDYACGELVWGLSGAREETHLVFTKAERRRPINFRELRGCLRAIEVFGERLRGRTVLMEVDNTCAYEAARKLSCKAEDLQELVRRLLERLQRFEITLRPTHTPGAMLDRPDQTSRGAAVEEPRCRLTAAAFASLQQRSGPFTEFLGAEREHRQPAPAELKGGGSLWLHPTYDTVGSALRLIGERMDPSPDLCASGLVVVPCAPEAAWWPLTRHLLPVGRLWAGGSHLEENRVGTWHPVTPSRESAIFSFPRAAGAFVYLLSDAIGMGQLGLGGQMAVGPDGPLPAGTLLFSAPFAPIGQPRGPGCVYLTLETYDGCGRPVCAHLHDGGSAAAARRREAGSEVTLMLNQRSYGPQSEPWLPAVQPLWVINHLGRVMAPNRWELNFTQVEAELSAARRSIERPFVAAAAGPAETAELTAAASAEPSGASAEDADRRPVSGYARRPEEREFPTEMGTPERGVSAEEVSPRAKGPTPRRLRAPQAAVEGYPVSRCFYQGRLCSATHCNERIGTWAVSVGSGMTHNSVRCITAAATAMEAEAEAARVAALEAEAERLRLEQPAITSSEPSEAVEAKGGIARDGSDQRRAQLREALGPSRRLMIRACLAGKCGRTDADEKPMVCMGEGCHARLHGVFCAQISRGFASVGCFTCTSCVLKACAPGVISPSPEAVDSAEETMIIGLTVGAEATGGSLADVVQLETAFAERMTEMGGGGGTVSPRDDPLVACAFLAWVVVRKERALSLDAIWRALGSLAGRTRKSNVTHDSRVKAYYSNLREIHGEESHPRTATTRRMVRHLYDSVIARHFSKGELRARAKLLTAMEIMLGLRIGEGTGGGDHHGVLANHVCVLWNSKTGEESVEAMLEHSKTKHKRWINAVGESQGEGRVPLAQCLREYWRAAGFTLRTRMEGGYEVTGPDYFVLRVSLMGLRLDSPTDARSCPRLELMLRLLARSRCPEARRQASAVAVKARQRLKAVGSAEKRYVNVTGGPRGADTFNIVNAELVLAGFGELLGAHVPGPLIRATEGSVTTHMPLTPNATYAALHATFDEAYRLANGVAVSHWRTNGEGVAAEHWHDRDPELDLMGLAAPRWGHHSNRRLADTVARQTRKETGATEQDIDIIFGWMENFYSAKMQMHYESKFDREQRKVVTMMV